VPAGTPGAIVEAFKAGTAPGEANAAPLATVTAGDAGTAPVNAVNPGQAGPARGTTGVIGEGTGGLY
jgi:penicillin-binding protein 1A